MTNTSSLVQTIVVGVAAFIAIYMGMTVVNSQVEAMFWVGLAAVLVVCVWLGKDIWLLIPATLGFNLMFPWLPGGFPPGRVAILLVIGWSALLVAMRRLPLRFKFTHIELAALLVLGTILQGYVRNPVGLAALGSDTVGAKPYAMIVISTLGGLLLASLDVTPDRVRRAARAWLLGSVFSTTVNLLAYLSGTVASITGPVFGAFGKNDPFADSGFNQGLVDTSAATRIGAAGELSGLVSRWLASVRNPFRSLAHPFWGSLVLLSLASAAMTGFRNALISTGLTLAFGTFYWGRGRSVLAAGFLAAIGYLLLVLINPIAPLPPNVQRTMTILPGPWDQKYKDDAKDSTEWRTTMWTLALTTDRYIQNKVFGDGLGMTQKEYNTIISTTGNIVSNEMSQERAMATQAYHSGPVQTVRVSGYVGLVILLYALILVAVHAHRMIIRSRGTEWFGVVLFMVLHMVWHPIFFTFVFGAFGDDVPSLFINIGVLRLIENNLPLPAYQTSRQRALWRGLPVQARAPLTQT